MEYRLRDIPVLLKAPVGRRRLALGLQDASFPLMRRVAFAYRRAVARRVRVVAVVGSYGKTTTARAVLAALGLPLDKLIGLNARMALVQGVLQLRWGQARKVLEIGISRPGQMAAYASMIRPDVAVVTCVGSEHHRSLGTLETTRAEKSAVVRALPGSGTAVLNADDPNVLWMGGQTAARVVTFGCSESADVRATNVVRDWPRGLRFTLEHAGAHYEVATLLHGRHQVSAILAAVAVATVEGLGVADAIAALAGLAPTQGRLEAVPLGDRIWLVRDEFKSSLETIHASLDFLAEVPAERRLVVMGEVSEPPGSQGPIYRELGGRLAEIAASAVFVGGNFQRYAAGALAAGMSRDSLIDVGRDVLRAVEAVRSLLRPGDVVLVKGRDTQRLERVSLALLGRTVRCEVASCSLQGVRCHECPMLARGWDGLRVIV